MAGPLSELVFMLGPMHVAASAVCWWLPAFTSYELSCLWQVYVLALTPAYLVDHFARRAWGMTEPLFYCLSFMFYLVPNYLCYFLRQNEINLLFLHDSAAAVAPFPWTKYIVTSVYGSANLLWQFLSYPAPEVLVVTYGPHRYMRNPMATGMLWTQFFNYVLIYGSARVGIFLVFEFVILTAWFKYFEEPDLKERFGQRYEAYCKHVPRWLPRLSPYREKRTHDALGYVHYE